MSPSIGEQLRAARESRRLSLEDAFKATRIRVPYLQALENDNLDALPSKVHARGFLRLYASYLEITPEITDSNEIISTPPQEEKQAPVVEAEEPVELQPQEPVVVLVEEEKPTTWDRSEWNFKRTNLFCDLPGNRRKAAQTAREDQPVPGRYFTSYTVET